MPEPVLGAEMRAICAFVAFMLTCIAYLPYYADTLAWRTRPQRASWLIWGVLSTISFASQVTEGATTSLVFAGIQCAGTLGIMALATSRGIGGFLNRRDRPVLLAAGAGLVAWYLTDDAAWALCISCSISLIGGTVTVAKAYRYPQSETLPFWFTSFVASLFAIGSVGGWDPILLMYPVYLMTLKGSVVVAILLGRQRPHPVMPRFMPLDSHRRAKPRVRRGAGRRLPLPPGAQHRRARIDQRRHRAPVLSQTSPRSPAQQP